MKIIFKLTIGFIFISILIGLLAYIGHNTIASIQNEYEMLAYETVPVFENLNYIKLAGIRIIDTTNEKMSLSPDNIIRLEEENRELALAKQTYEISFKEYEHLVNTFFPEEKEILMDIENTTQELIRISDELIELQRQGSEEYKIKEKQVEIEIIEEKFLIIMDRAIEQEKKELKEKTINGEEKITDMRKTSIVAGFFVLISAISTGIFISNRLSTSIVKLKNASVEIGKGNLDTRIDIRTKDEIEELSHIFNKMAIDLKKSMNETISAKNFSNNIIKSMVETLVVLDIDGTIKIANKSLLRLLEYGENELTGKSIRTILEEELMGSFRNENGVIDKNIIISHETNYLTKSGKKIPVAFSASVMHDNGKFEGIVCVGKDITEQKISNEVFKKSLQEKEMLLREIHHRVKNNMQIISSLLMLQSDKIEDKKYIDIFTDSHNRILSMALIHEKLYQSENIAHIDIKEYIKDLVSNLIYSYAATGNVKLDIKVENIPLNIDLAVPCGLIINELVTNSLKYAFPEGRKGKITIVFISKDNNDLQLCVSDDGIGIPPDLDIGKTKSLGLNLVTALAENQLHGKIILNRERGTEIQINFKGV